MKHNVSLRRAISISFIAIAFIAVACSTVPLTGRQQLSLISESEMIAMSLTQYSQFLDSNKVTSKSNDALMVKRCGENISRAVEAYMVENGFSNQLKGFEWEFNLVEDKSVNAWCMPGGKVVFYTGILPLTKNENGLAVVMGHEIAHAVAKHGNERMSQQMLTQFGGVVLSEAISNKPNETQQMWMTVFGAGAQLGVMLPFSRKHEYEADRLGTIFMAMAGYDPNEAVNFWQRMSEQGGQRPPEFLSTHPLDQNRINYIKQILPEAMQYYQKYKN
jgi:predicted Zn-dependent protease